MQRPVPEWAKVPASEYRRLRSEMQRTGKAAGYDWTDMWNLAIAEMTKRHDNVLKGRAKNDLTLAEAVVKVQKEAVKARMEVEMERAEATLSA